MFELFFGIAWTAIIAIITFAMYGATGGTIRVNGEIVSQSEFNSMLWPKLFIGLFWAVGIWMIILGIRKLLINAKTSLRGVRTYGVVVDILETNCYSNGHPQLKADVVVILENKSTQRYQEVIGYDYNKYRIGEVLSVKHCDKDINILGIAIDNQIPYGDRSIIERIRMEYNCDMQYVASHSSRSYVVTDTGRKSGATSQDNYNDGYQNGYSSRDPYAYNDGYTTNTVMLDGEGYDGPTSEPASNIQHVDSDTVIINGVEYKRNS